MSEKQPLDQRSKRRLARTGIPQSIVRGTRASPPTTAHPATAPARTTVSLDTTSDDSDDGDDAPRTITTCVSVHTHGGDMVKRPRPSTSSSGGSDEQEDKRVKLTRLALSGSQSMTTIPPSAYPGAPSHHEELISVAAPCITSQVTSAPTSRSHDPSMPSSNTPHESASWPKDSTSYAGLPSPVQHDVPMRPASPQPGTSYAAAAAAPASLCRPPQPAPAPQPNAQVPRSAYPPLVVERLPNWTRHFEALGTILGHAPNARPLGGGVRFLPKSTDEFRAVQRYLTAAAAQDSAISWYCYSPATEIPAKVAVRGLPQDTPTEEVVAALCARGFPAEAARAIPPPRGKHGGTYFVRLAHMSNEELRDLYATTELLYMPDITIEAWRGGQKPPQCFRCQTYSHSSTNCHRPVRCVRCAGEHAVQDCTRPRDQPTCANCGQGHAANDRRCAHYRREARRRGIAQPPPPPSAKQRRREQQRANVPAPEPRRNARPNAGTAPASTAPSAAAPAPAARAFGVPAPAARAAAAPAPAARTAAPARAAPAAAATVAAASHTETAPQPAATAPARAARAAPVPSAARPTTLVADANPPTARGARTRRRRNRAPRPARAAPAAASTPQQRQPRDGAPAHPAAAPRAVPASDTAPTARAPPSAPSAHHPAQGEAQANPDLMAIVRVVVEALSAGLTTYLQGQGALQAMAAGMGVLLRLHSY